LAASSKDWHPELGHGDSGDFRQIFHDFERVNIEESFEVFLNSRKSIA
jgi:hypothetical protein